ncbi:MAG: bifunctional phosphopantothenoylcysteine decarboxylase/phosphopantothenate--cysteine ligase CoaBC [Bacteroidetes bacterium]|nr:bifunctional phosphopantothenoylcysteine decarboxylase/phosphopantothenate--cysteine ligase CoaBC [Bacteroidota bacterium]
MLQGKRIVLGVTGGIAAYKAALLVRLLVKNGAEVKVVMTRAAHDFVTPLTLATLSKHEVLTEFVADAHGTWNNHVELGLWADVLIIAPATANTLAKLAHGQCDNLLLAVCLSARCPVMVAPAMDVDMYHHAATQANLHLLKSRDVHVIPPGTGELASGLSGEGRLAEPEEIVKHIAATFAQAERLSGKHILVTAGPTYEAIDPVRFIGNHSTGKMGFALAEELARRGADVTLVTGPVALHTQHPRIKRISITSAQEMYEAATAVFDQCDAAILSAAVADFRPKNAAGSKIKKEAGGVPQIELEQTPDTLAELGRRKTGKQILAGFALETDNEEANAQSKLTRKNLDFIVLNSLRDEGAGFGKDTNRISLLTREGKTLKFELKTKSEVAADIADYLQTILT